MNANPLKYSHFYAILYIEEVYFRKIVRRGYSQTMYLSKNTIKNAIQGLRGTANHLLKIWFVFSKFFKMVLIFMHNWCIIYIEEV